MRNLNHSNGSNYSDDASSSTDKQGFNKWLTSPISNPSSASSNSDINILILGKTGVGKSTLINGISNYLKFGSFEDAIAAKKPDCLIPMYFELYNEKLEKITIRMEKTEGFKDDNEATEACQGQSSTQVPKVYSYIVDNVKYNFIDSPGVGDTRGFETDMKNIQSIFSCLSKWNKIHGICLLLKPNQSRLTISLRYCIEELLVNLHKNAIPNICVIFTNACNTNFKPGDTMTVLKHLFEDVKGASQNVINLNNANTYCLDNEAIRMLYASFKGMVFDQKDISIISKSWSHSARETRRLFKYISELDPHSVVETKGTHEMRTLLMEACTELAERQLKITRLEKVLRDYRTTKKNLKSQKQASQISIQIETIKNTPTKFPNTVCTGPKCIETIWNPKTNKPEIFYHEVCCSPCPLRDVPKDQSGNPKLRSCEAFHQSSGTCKKCKCSWQAHMQIWYSQGKVKEGFSSSRKKVDYEKLRQTTSESIKATKLQIQDTLFGYSILLEASKNYFDFLLKNAIIIFNSAVEDYIEISIQEGKELKISEIEALEKYQTTYSQLKLISQPNRALISTVINECESSDESDDNASVIPTATLPLNIPQLPPRRAFPTSQQSNIVIPSSLTAPNIATSTHCCNDRTKKCLFIFLTRKLLFGSFVANERPC